MIFIRIPNNNISERKYILQILFGEFLNIEYSICIEENDEDFNSWEITLKNKNKLIFEDQFFSKFKYNKEYLNIKNIPKQIFYQRNKKNHFIYEKDIPIIYGKDYLNIIKNNNISISCGIDIFASSYFMLTRWEEYVSTKRDIHNRFPANQSLAFKNNFLNRPIVNEYLEMLKTMLIYLDKRIYFRKKKFQLFLTHDVDHIYKWDSLKKVFRHILGDLFLRKSITELRKSIKDYIKHKLGLINDPYDTFDYLMNISEKANTKSYFFFMGKGITSYDNNYSLNSKAVSQLIKKIKNRGHYIGLHSTYSSNESINQLHSEKSQLESVSNLPITFGRCHYLRMEIPKTWELWDRLSMDWDCTSGYADKEGFRNGVCYEYSVFNFLSRTTLKLKEFPLILMEESLVTQGKSPTKETIKKTLIYYYNCINRYNGNLVILWHNSSFNTYYWRKHYAAYSEFLNEISTK
jgi:hypothetical protein